MGTVQIKDSEEEIELKPGGKEIIVTDDNKGEYVKLVKEFLTTGRIQKQMDSFIEGFSQFIPMQFIKIFSEEELELMMCGKKELDVHDWQQNTYYYDPYSAQHQIIIWFW